MLVPSGATRRRLRSLAEFGRGEEAAAYMAELEARATEDIDALYDSETSKALAEAVAKRELDEKSRFFNWPSAAANFDHWSKAACWSLDEAVALALGRDPTVVSWDKLKSYVDISAFAGRYRALRDLTLRARTMQQLFDPVIPGVFLGWAKRNEIAYPTELEARVVERGNHVGDWKSAFDDMKALHMRESATSQALIEEKDAAIRELGEQRDTLVARLAEAEKPSRADTVGGKERESVLKLILGMAMGGYAYDPKAQRNTATRDITDDLDRLGLSLDPDTVRKWLKEGLDLLPPQPEEDSDP